MLTTFIVYNSIFIFAVFFAYFVENSEIKWQRSLCRCVLFLILWIPAAIRFDIGTDYKNYVDLFWGVKSELYLEWGFQFLFYTVRKLNLGVQAVFVISSFFIYFPVCFFLRRKYFTFTIVFYILILYLSSYSIIRQALVVSVSIWAMSLYLDGKTLRSIFVVAFATLFHSSAFLILPLFLIAKIKLNRMLLLGLLFVGGFFLYKFNFIELIFGSDLFLDSSYGGYANSSFNTDAEVGSGLGILLNLILPILVILSRDRILTLNNRYLFLTNLVIIYAYAALLAANVHIFNRFLDTFRFVPVMMIFPLVQSFSKKLTKQLVLCFFLLTNIVIVFEKGVLANDKKTDSGTGASPYTTIFDK